MINKRIFGADIPILVKKKLEARQRVAEGNKLPGESITDSKYKDNRKSYYKYDELITSDFEMEADLSSRTPFARMWTAVSLVRPLDVNIDEELKNKTFDQLTDDEKKGYKVITHKIYAIGTNNLSTIDSLDNPNQSLDNTSELNYAIFPNELGEKKINDTTIEGNKFLKPQAGITGVSSETGGTLGSIKTTEVKFMVHNFTDYDQIYNKYFLRPGAQVFVDFGWSSLRKPLYNPSDLLDDSDGFGVETKLYGEADSGDGINGYVTEQAGDQETLIGIVTGYDSKIMENGSVECTVTLTSKNSALNLSPKLPSQNVETSEEKFIFEIDNLIKFEALYTLGNKDTRTNMMEALKKANSSSGVREKVAFEQYINELAFSSFGGKGNINPTTLAIESGVFLVGDDAVSNDQFLAWGVIEDKLLNKYFGHGDDLDKVNEGENLEIGINSSKSFTTYHKEWNLQQKNTKYIPSFVVPPYWDRTHQSNLIKGGKSGRTVEERRVDIKNLNTEEIINAIDSFKQKIDLDNSTTKYFVQSPTQGKTPISKYDEERFRVPIREIFINSTLVKKAFTNDSNTTFKAVVNEILDGINEESYGIWNWVLAGDGDSNKLSVIDTNQLGISEAREENRFEKTFMFNVMSKDSIVTTYDVSFDMPEGEIGSMYAIQAMSGTSKKMYPISTLIEEQATLQSLLSKVGEDNGKLRFRYLPDIGTLNAEQMDSDASDNSKYSSLYNTSANIIDSQQSTEPGYGINFDPEDKFENFLTKDSEELSEEAIEAFDQAELERTIQLNEESGVKTYTEEEARKIKITGAFEEEKLPKPMPFPMKLTLKIYGISTLKPGDIFRVDYLPQVYLEKVYFQVLSVSHDINSDGWYTELETQFRIKPEEVDNPIIIDAPVKDEQTEGEEEVIVGQTDKGKDIKSKDKYKSNRAPIGSLAVDFSTSPLLKREGGEINDKDAFRDGASHYGHATWTDDAYKQTYHIPDYGYFNDGGYHNIDYEETYHNRKTFKDLDGFKLYKNRNVKYIMNYKMLFTHFQTVWDEFYDTPDGHSKNLTFLYKVTLKLNDPKHQGIMISNPMYKWAEGYNRYNGYGISTIFDRGRKMREDAKHTKLMINKGSLPGQLGDGKKVAVYPPVRGIYRHGEQVWFGGRTNDGKNGQSTNTHWFVAPCGTFDKRQFVQDWRKDSTNYLRKISDESYYGDGSQGFTKSMIWQFYDFTPNQSYDSRWGWSEVTGEAALEAGTVL